MKTHRVFPTPTTVTGSTRRSLRKRGLLTEAERVVSWSLLSPFLSNRLLSQDDAKKLVLLELEAPTPRPDHLRRLAGYLGTSVREETLSKLGL